MDINAISEISKRMQQNLIASSIINFCSLLALLAMIFYKESSKFFGTSTGMLVLVATLTIFVCIVGNLFLRAKWQRDFQLMMNIIDSMHIEVKELLSIANDKRRIESS